VRFCSNQNQKPTEPPPGKFLDSLEQKRTIDPAESDPLMPGEVQVVEVRIVGNESFKRAIILPHIHTRAGRPFRMSIIEKDVRRLYKTGMFATVEPLYEDTPNGRIVIFRVTERPTLGDVVFVRQEKLGWFDKLFSSPKKQEEKLRKESGLSPGDPADPFAVEEARRALEDYYREKGYARVRVTVAEGSSPKDRRAVFIIHEGPKEKIVWTQFVGNTIATDGRLLTQVESKQGILWIFKGEFDRKKIKTDEENLTAYYRSLGFFQARVGHDVEYARVPFAWSEPKPVVTFVIDEGPRWKVRNVSFLGNDKIDTAELEEAMKLHSGDFFNQDKMNGDVRRIREEYGGIGHVFCDVKAEPRFREEPAQMDLVYSISEGDRYRVGRIVPKITGDNPHTKITTLLNPLSLQPGDIIDTREIRASETRYLASQVFNIDRQKGQIPKIVFSPSDAKQVDYMKPRDRMAGRPESPEGFRGQSPDEYDGRETPRANDPRGPAAPNGGFLPEPGSEYRTPAAWLLPGVFGPATFGQDGGIR